MQSGQPIEAIVKTTSAFPKWLKTQNLNIRGAETYFP